MKLALLMERFPELVANFPTIRLVYLFGSQVTGKTGPLSDYDIAIVLGPDDDPYGTEAAFQHEIVKYSAPTG